MTDNHWFRILICALLLLTSLELSAQTATCKDTAAHRRLQQEMWDAAKGNNPSKVYKAAQAFQKHADAEGDLEAHYNAWMCGIAFNLDRLNIRDAYHIAVSQKNDLRNVTGGKEEQYMGPMMMGQVYNVCGNVPGAISELKEAIELVKGTRYESEILHSLYLALAHLTLVSDLDQSMQWVEEGIKVLNEHKHLPNYQKGLGSACAMKSIIYFKKGDYQNFNYWYNEAMKHGGNSPTGYSGIFMSYAGIYKKAFDGDVSEALTAADSIQSMKERYIMKCDLYVYAGEMDKAFKTQHELMLLNDSITGTMLADNIGQMEHDIDMMKHQQKMSRNMIIILFVGLALLVLAIVLMQRNLMIRSKFQRRLLAKNKELRAAYKKVAAVNEMKTSFIRNVSHELRTPLNIIYGFTQVLTDEENAFAPEERHEIANTIGENTRQITSLVNTMLALANDSTKDLLKEVEDTNALEICKRAISSMPKTDPEKIKVILDNQTAVDDSIICTHGDSLLQMLGNLLENAVKFTEKGYIRLGLSKDETNFHFTVEDTGCGIPEEKVSTIFKRFMKVNDFTAGLGLGLAYCHETAEKLGGSLVLDKTSDTGTTFILSLPIKLNKITNSDESTNRAG